VLKTLVSKSPEARQLFEEVQRELEMIRQLDQLRKI
jgi:hypothetical protein